MDSTLHSCMVPVLPLRLRYPTAEGINLRKVANKTSAIVRHDTSFIDQIEAMAIYVHAFETKYGVSFRDIRVNCVIDDRISPDFSSSDSRSVYVRYVHASKLLLKHYTDLPFSRSSLSKVLQS